MKYRVAAPFLLLTVSTCVFAKDSDFEGFYLQGLIGYDAFLAEDNTNSLADYTSLDMDSRSLSLSNQHHEYADGVAGDLSIGYLYPVSKWFSIGAELGLGILKEDLTVSSNNATAVSYDSFQDASALHAQDTISREALEPTFDILLGVNPTDDFMIFGLVGVAYNEMSLTTINAFDYSGQDSSSGQDGFAFTQSYEQDTNTSVFLRVGLGMLYEIYDDVAFNVTYTFTDYRDLSTQSTNDIILCQGNDNVDNICAPTGVLSSNSQADVTDNRVLFGINYFL